MRELLAVCLPEVYTARTSLAGPSPWARSRVRRACAFNVRIPWFKGEQVVLPPLDGVAQMQALVLQHELLKVLT